MKITDNSTYRLKSIASVLRGRQRAMTADELADMLNMSPITILRKAKKGVIPSFRIGGSVRFDPAAISKWLLSHTGMQSMSAPEKPKPVEPRR